MADINAILDGTDGDEALNLNDLDEKEVLGDDEDDQHQNQLATKDEVDDLYDEAMAPSGALSEKRESAEVISSLPNSVQLQHKSSFAMPATIKSELGFGGGSQSGKRYCCYIGNMTWWTTDEQLQKLIQTLGVDDLMDVKFYENRNNGQSKGFALAVFASEPSVKSVMEKLPSKKLHDQSLAVLPYTKQSLAKLEEATKRYDQKGQKDEKVVNIGTVRIGANGAPVPQLMSSVNLTQLARPVSQASSVQPTSLLSLNFPTPPAGSRPPPTASAPAPGLVVSAGTVPVAASQQQQQQMAVAAAASLAAAQQHQQQQHSFQLLQQQQRHQQFAASISQHHQQLGGGALGGGTGPGGGISVPPPNIVVAQQQPQQHPSQQQQQQVAVVQQQQAAHVALQNVMSRPPPAIHQSIAGINTAAPPPTMSMAVGLGGGLMPAYQQQQRQPTMMTAMGAAGQQMMAAPQMQAMQPPPGFPPGAHINPQVYPGFGASAYMDNGAAVAMITEVEFQEIMNRNQTVSSSAIHRAVSDAASGDYASAIETLVTAISLIRQSRVAHDDRCKLLVNTLQDTLKGIEAQSYSGGGVGISRKHRVRERSRSPIRSSKRHRRSRSRSRSRDYSPLRYSSAMSSRRF
uniref:RRM domain-containing protein n=1 Tax=Globodera rostochiensis TaxID=31243 RepID=A0A914I5C1_GLORO